MNTRVEGGEDVEQGRRAFEAQGVVRKPDWLRESLPDSLMDTRVTQVEDGRSVLSRVVSRDQIGLPRRQTEDVVNVVGRASSKDVVALPRGPST